MSYYYYDKDNGQIRTNQTNKIEQIGSLLERIIDTQIERIIDTQTDTKAA